MKQLSIFLFSSLLLIQAPAFANPALEMKVDELARLVHELQQTVALQQQQIDSLKGSAAIPAPSGAVNGPQVPGGATRGRWNPDIGVIGDMVFKHDSPKNEADGSDRLSVRELELVFGSFVDPYSRLDASVSFTDLEEVELHEAYLTRFGLPLDTTARLGRSKVKVGKALPSHRDTLETVDYPLVIRRYFGEEGLNKTGLDLTTPIDLPFDSAHEITAGIIEGGNGEAGSVFGDSRRRPTAYTHLRNFWDLSEVTNFELGGSHMIGSSDTDSGFESNLFGLDGTLNHFYGPDQRVKLQSELFYLNQQESEDQHRLGSYALLDVRFHKRWSAGMRFDYAQLVNRPPVSPGGWDTGVSGYLTFFQTEFTRWRLQYSHINSERNKDDDQILVQGIFAIGEHKHKLQ